MLNETEQISRFLEGWSEEKGQSKIKKVDFIEYPSSITMYINFSTLFMQDITELIRRANQSKVSYYISQEYGQGYEGVNFVIQFYK